MSSRQRSPRKRHRRDPPLERLTDAKIGIDVGGTFTDVAAMCDGVVTSAKVPSTGPDPTLAVQQALQEILQKVKTRPASVVLLRHGTTVATNAMIEGTYPRVGLLTTAGFRDLLEIGRQRRPDLYDLFFDKPRPLVPRELRREVAERLSAGGEVVRSLSEEDVWREASWLRGQGVAAIAICFLHSYANPVHELKAHDVITATLSDFPVVLSSAVHPEYREFERTSTTVIHASLSPVMVKYLTQFASTCRQEGVTTSPQIMQSNGGVASVEDVIRTPARALLSGPAAGVMGALEVGQTAGYRDLITLDMGGTSTDISLLQDAVPSYTQVREVGGYPVRGSAMDVTTIGAGGGSIAWIDSGGRLRVGPRSAGSRPGPAAYGEGGLEATVTDANVVTGRLPADVQLGGRIAMDFALAISAVKRHIADKLQLTEVDAARAVLRVVNTNMALALRKASVERGHDPRDYALVAYGGAGPLHAIDVARDLAIPMVIVPPSPGTLCAIGLLAADMRTEFSMTRVLPAAGPSLEAANRAWAHLSERAKHWRERHERMGSFFEQYEVDMRYRGQHFELPVTSPPPPWRRAQLDIVLDRFYHAHARVYGYSVRDEPTEFVNFRRVTMIRTPRATNVVKAQEFTSRPAPILGISEVVWLDSEERVKTTLIARDDLAPGDYFAGPAIVLQNDSTVAVPPGSQCSVDLLGNLIVVP